MLLCGEPIMHSAILHVAWKILHKLAAATTANLAKQQSSLFAFTLPPGVITCIKLYTAKNDQIWFRMLSLQYDTGVISVLIQTRYYLQIDTTRCIIAYLQPQCGKQSDCIRLMHTEWYRLMEATDMIQNSNLIVPVNALSTESDMTKKRLLFCIR